LSRSDTRRAACGTERLGMSDVMSTLSVSRQRLVRLMQVINFGRIEGLAVREGEPVFDPDTRIIRDIKFGGENGPRPERGTDNFALKSQVVELFKQLDDLKNGIIDTLAIKHGLPFSMSVQNAA